MSLNGFLLTYPLMVDFLSIDFWFLPNLGKFQIPLLQIFFRHIFIFIWDSSYTDNRSFIFVPQTSTSFYVVYFLMLFWLFFFSLWLKIYNIRFSILTISNHTIQWFSVKSVEQPSQISTFLTFHHHNINSVLIKQ